MDAVYIIVGAQLSHSIGYVLPHRRVGRVQVGTGIGVFDPIGVQRGRAGVAERRGQPSLDAVGVDPGFQCKPPVVGGLHQQGQRVIAGVPPLLPGAKVAERVVAAGVECIPKGPHLRQHDSGPQVPDIVQYDRYIARKRLRRGKIHLLPFQVTDPHGAVGRGGGWLCRGRGRRCGSGRSLPPPGQRCQRGRQKNSYYK